MRLHAEVALDHRARGAVSGGTTEAMITARRPAGRRRDTSEQVRHQQPELVGRPLAQRRQAPAVHQRLAIEDAEDDVRVADVELEHRSKRSNGSAGPESD